MTVQIERLTIGAFHRRLAEYDATIAAHEAKVRLANERLEAHRLARTNFLRANRGHHG
jgi:hypothetical protein